MRQAEEGVEALQKMVDTLIIIPTKIYSGLPQKKQHSLKPSVWQMTSCTRV